MAPLMIREYFNDKRSISSRVVFDKMTPPRPEPALASPWDILVSLCSNEQMERVAYLCKAQLSIKPVCKQWLRRN
jgi:hypothetical protein